MDQTLQREREARKLRLFSWDLHGAMKASKVQLRGFKLRSSRAVDYRYRSDGLKLLSTDYLRLNFCGTK